jgi:hypothetical protein
MFCTDSDTGAWQALNDQGGGTVTAEPVVLQVPGTLSVGTDAGSGYIKNKDATVA